MERQKFNAQSVHDFAILTYFPVEFFHFCFFINYVDELSLLCAKLYVGAVRGRVPNEGVNTYFENAVYSN